MVHVPMMPQKKVNLNLKATMNIKVEIVTYVLDCAI